jgi:transcriptional regulator with XRE-family HTH domain
MASGSLFRGTALKSARLRAGLTQAQLAERVGVSDGSRVGAWERDAAQPAPSRLARLVAVLDVDPLDLYEVADRAAPPLEVLRRASGLTLHELSERSGLSFTRCQQIERGTIQAGAADTAALAAALGVPQELVCRSVLGGRGSEEASR